MTQKLWPGSLGAISKEEDLKLSRRFPINPPPSDGRCHVCGKHIKELKPFGGPGDPLLGNFSGELLVKIWRPMGPYDEEAEKAWEEAEKETQGSNNPLPWLIAKYGKEKAEDISFSVQAYGSTGSSWECRDCIVLNNDEYFERRRQSFQERENR